MGIRSERNIYTILEKYLREADRPLTCVDLMEVDEIRREANKEFGKEEATNRLSDALGFMWRRELLTQLPRLKPALPDTLTPGTRKKTVNLSRQ